MVADRVSGNIFDDADYHYADEESWYSAPVEYIGRTLQSVSSIDFRDIQEIFASIWKFSLNEIGSFSVYRGRVKQVTSQEPVGEVGDREINARVRLSAINGIQYTLLHARSLWKEVSKEFGTKVHYVYYQLKVTILSMDRQLFGKSTFK